MIFEVIKVWGNITTTIERFDGQDKYEDFIAFVLRMDKTHTIAMQFHNDYKQVTVIKCGCGWE